jgi:RNA polymerase sigma factor (sigma-70 family)
MARERTELHRDLVALVPQLRRFAYALTRHVDDADDLVQATVERVLSRPLPDDVELVKWMFRVSRNIWIDDLRSRKVRRDAVMDVAAETELEVSTEERVAARAMLRRTQEGIDALPNEQREVLAMVAIAGMAYREAAEALAIPIGTVMSRLARARAALAAHLEAAS